MCHSLKLKKLPYIKTNPLLYNCNFKNVFNFWLSHSYICVFLFFFGHPTAYRVPRPGIRSKPQLPPTLQLWQCRILNPLCGNRNGTCVPTFQRYLRFHCTTGELPFVSLYCNIIMGQLKVVSRLQITM